MNMELKKVVDRVRAAQEQLQGVLKSRTWVEDARKYAERQGKEVRKLFSADVAKVKRFLVRERRELEKFQKMIPGEVRKLRKYVNGQKREFERLLDRVKDARVQVKGGNVKVVLNGAKKTTARRVAKTTRKKTVKAEPTAQA